MKSSGVVVGLLLLLGAKAAADPLGDARAHYSRLEYDQALVSLEQARTAAAGEPMRLAEVELLEGFVEVGLGRSERAMTAFRRALRANPMLKAPRDVSPKLLQVFDRAVALEHDRRQRRSDARVRLFPPSQPPCAGRVIEVTAEVRGVFAGLAVMLQVSDGARGLRATLPMVARKAGRYATELPAEFARAGATLSLRVDLADEGEVFASDPKTGAISLPLPSFEAAIAVSSPMIGAELLVDGQPKGRIPISAPLPVTPGRVRLELRSPSGNLAQNVDARRGEITQTTLALGAQRGLSALQVTRATLLISGAVLLATGAVLAVKAGNDAGELERSVKLEPGSGLPQVDYSSVRGLAEDGKTFAILSKIALITGGIAGAAGATLYFWPHPQAGEGHAARALDGWQVGLQGHF